MADKYLDCVSAINTALRAQSDVAHQAAENMNAQAVLTSGIGLANAVLSVLGCQPQSTADETVDTGVLSFPNTERQDSWFHQHPWMRGERAAFTLLDADSVPIQAKLYWLQKKSTAHIAGGVHFTKNWEDYDFTRTNEFKIGIDFFLTPDGSALLVVLSNRGNLRVVELRDRLTTTQVEIFQKWADVAGNVVRESLHAALWDSFKLQSVNAKFYDGVADAFNELVTCIATGSRDLEAAKLFSNRLLGRIIFVWFIRKMGMISETIDYFNANETDQGRYYRDRLEYLFFEVLNTPIDARSQALREQVDLVTPYLNGGLFAPHVDDWIRDETLTFPDGFFSRLYAHFDNFNFTTDESTPEYEQVAIDPEMLGRVFESLLASQIDSTGEQARKARGAFYTPREIVSYMCRESVRRYLQQVHVDDARWNSAISKVLDTPDHEWAIAGTNSLRDVPAEFRSQIVDNLVRLKSLDPACGSGAFPLGLLNLLTKIQLRLDPKKDVYSLKLNILRNNIFGTDIEPMAVEISRLRSWLSLIVEEKDKKNVAPLPNLDFNFVCANSLIPLQQEDLLSDPTLTQKLMDLRRTYFSVTRPNEKKKLQSEFIQLVQPDLLDALDDRSRQLKSFNPFSEKSMAEFFDAEYMFGIDNGFNLVIGNPPYVSALAAKKSLPPRLRDLYKREYASANGAYDLYILFLELGLRQLSHDGILCFITPTKYVSAKYAESFRELASAKLQSITDFSNQRVFDSAGVSTLVSFFSDVQTGENVSRDDYVGNGEGDEMLSRTEIPRSALSEFPENIWGPLKWGSYPIISQLYSTSQLLQDVAQVGASSTAAEADLWAQHIHNLPTDHSYKMVNTGTIGSCRFFWGLKEYSNKRTKILTPYLDAKDVDQRRADMFGNPKLIISKLSKRLTVALDNKGEYASSNTVFVQNPVGSLNLHVLLGLLNSSVIQYVYRSIFSGLNLLGSFQFQAPQIRLLPVPKKADSADLDFLKELVESAIDLIERDLEYLHVMEEIDDLVFKLYGLNTADQELIRRSLQAN